MTTYTPQQRAQALELYKTHGPTHVQKTLGIPKGTVTKWAKADGVPTVSSPRTREATEAASLNARSRRQAIIERMYARSEFLLARVESEGFETLVPTGPGVQEPKTLGFVPAVDERQLAAALTSYLSNAQKLELVDVDSSSGEVGSVVDDLRRAFKVIAEGAPE